MSSWPAALACAAHLMGIPDAHPTVVHVACSVPSALCAQSLRGKAGEDCAAVEVMQSYGLLVIGAGLDWPRTVHAACHAQQWDRLRSNWKAGYPLPGSAKGEAECEAIERRASECRRLP